MLYEGRIDSPDALNHIMAQPQKP